MDKKLLDEYESLWEKYSLQKLNAEEIVRFFQLVDKFQKEFLQDDIDYWKRKARTKKQTNELKVLLGDVLVLNMELPKRKPHRIPK